MSQPFIVRSLSIAEHKSIWKLRKHHPNVEVHQRTQAVYFSSQRLKVQQIAEIVGHSRISVTRWLALGRRVIVPSAGINRKVPVSGDLDAMTGELTALVTEKKRSGEFLNFLYWLVEEIYGDREHIYLFLDNCSIHHTKAVREYIDSCRERLTIIWNSTYAPNLNLIERFWGHLKRSAIHSYYFETVRNLEEALIKSV